MKSKHIYILFFALCLSKINIFTIEQFRINHKNQTEFHERQNLKKEKENLNKILDEIDYLIECFYKETLYDQLKDFTICYNKYKDLINFIKKKKENLRKILETNNQYSDFENDKIYFLNIKNKLLNLINKIKLEKKYSELKSKYSELKSKYKKIEKKYNDLEEVRNKIEIFSKKLDKEIERIIKINNNNFYFYEMKKEIEKLNNEKFKIMNNFDINLIKFNENYNNNIKEISSLYFEIMNIQFNKINEFYKQQDIENLESYNIDKIS